MNKLLTWTAILFVASSAVLQGQDCIIKESSGKEKKVSQITVRQNGDLAFVESGSSRIQSIIKRGRYVWAWVPKPKEIIAADELFKAGEYAKAGEAYKSARPKYKLVGWDVYCLLKQAESLVKEDKKSDAVKLLSTLENYKLVNPKMEQDLMESYRLLASTYIDLGETEKAIPVLDKMIASSDDDIASYAFIKKGDAIAKKGDKMDAVLAYFQAALLFPKSKERPEALFKSAQMLKELKDARAEKFVEMLKKDYPSDPYTKQLQ